MTVVLRLEDVVVRSDSRVILDVPSFAVTEGEVVGVLGPNGAGKSTLLRVACLLWKPDQGRVILDGKPASERDLRRATAAVLQRPLLRRGSVQRNVETGLRFRGRSRREARRLAEPWMRKLGIAELRACPTRQLSGGEGQRVSLARSSPRRAPRPCSRPTTSGRRPRSRTASPSCMLARSARSARRRRCSRSRRTTTALASSRASVSICSPVPGARWPLRSVSWPSRCRRPRSSR
jgi:ABC-type transport system involved in cytochrome c biogenesis ATPase subunit